MRAEPAPAPHSGAGLPALLIEAAGGGDVDAVRAVLQQGVPVDARDDGGATAPVRAAYGNHLEVAALLVQAGADVDLIDDTQQSAYLISTSEVGDDPRLLELTLNAGADVEARDSFDGTGLIRPRSAATRGLSSGCCEQAWTATTSTGSATRHCTRPSCSGRAIRRTRRRWRRWS